MNTKDFERLKDSVRQMVAIEAGEAEPNRSFVYSGKVLVAIKENGETVWTLPSAAEDAAETLDGATFSSFRELIKTLRKALNQTQAGFAELFDISLRTLQGWEQGRHTPSGVTKLFFEIAVRHPATVLESAASARDMEFA